MDGGEHASRTNPHEVSLLSRPTWLDQGTIASRIKHADLMVIFPCAEMILRSALVTIFALPALISGGEIPGIPSDDTYNSSYKNLIGSGSGDSSARTPGKLRAVVENSCICGGVLCLIRIPCHVHSFGRETRCLSSFRIW